MQSLSAPVSRLVSLSCGFSLVAVASTFAQGIGPDEPIRFGDPEGTYDAPFFPGEEFDESIPTPDALLGQLHGSRLTHHDEILDAFRTWDAISDRIIVHTQARTHEGRELIYAVITAPENHARLGRIQADLARLHDPRGLGDAEADRILDSSPAAAWMGYSIHGDELSGSDASLAVAYRLISSRSSEIRRILENVVVVIDPCLNPDGRERIIGMVEQSAGVTPNLDYASMQRGHWPFGRGNHYLFDMNRDWIAGTQPETRGRWAVARAFHPQLFVDAHEMGGLDTFLFYPQNAPLNPNLPPDLVAWQRRYAEGAAAAFDARGWSYYTREWADGWAPFYSDAWGSLLGATGMLYEQARTSGFPLRRRSGEILSYREAVHHQVVASLANLRVLSDARREALASYLETARRNVSTETPGNDRMFVCIPGPNHDRTRELRRILDGQGIEYGIAKSAFQATTILDMFGVTSEAREIPAGAIVVHAAQPQGPMVRAYLSFDVRIPHEDLVREREDLERSGTSRVYDITSWSLPQALDLDAVWCDNDDIELIAPTEKTASPAVHGDPACVAWLVSGADDASVSFAARAMEGGLAVAASDRAIPVRSDGDRVLPRGSIVVRLVENGSDREAIEAMVVAAAQAAGVPSIWRVGTQLTPDPTSPETPDLGGGHFRLLTRPRVGILSNSPVAPDTYGHLWFELDRRLGVPFSILDAQSFADIDLRRYNVLILPPGAERASLEGQIDALRTWVESGGTLIACGSAAAELTAGRLGLSSVVLRRDALEDLTPYRIQARRELDALEVHVDDEVVWNGVGEDVEPNRADSLYEEETVPEDYDRWLRRFSPVGATLLTRIDDRAWITAGAGTLFPAFTTGSYVFLTDSSASTPVRFSSSVGLRLGGLLWPEARERLADSSYVTTEPVGNGQIILFQTVPGFRGYHLATARLFANAVVLGPGLGASAPVVW
ncbi:MAG TPA: hypothetical protein ENJ09_04985 [Planctomycetes bacterium]|nr:hypothetical protein [Planctomycetota bacterium]